MAKQITDKVSWVGKVDWELTRFHGDEYSTHRGSSYNSYLIRDEKVALIDTVWLPYDREFVSRLKQEINLNDIDYIIMNHNEIDHSGALPELMREIPDTPIYCTKKGEAIIRGHYHQDWNFVNVKTGDTLSLGKSTLTFVEMTMLHWPDSMLTYMDGDNILFSNDAFGQHFASESLYNNTVNQADLMYEAEKYYANILNLYSPLVKKKIDQILAMNLPVDMICPSHGIIWKENPMQIVEKYVQWSNAYQENQITIAYDTMWQSTRKMAEAIAEGIRSVDNDVTLKIVNVAHDDKNDVLTEMFHSKAVLIGSPTINYGISFAISGLLEMMKGLKMRKKKAAAFGSYGWSGDAVKIINNLLKEGGFELVDDGLAKLWVPDEQTIEECREYGRNFAKSL
ncbi:MAG: anaerobic nitric oxide reductase flavorubredoxin [Prevotella sp.]|nr:anaerobic nitric oxide reductase flavorubredoxin [Prevotella sp.]